MRHRHGRRRGTTEVSESTLGQRGGIRGSGTGGRRGTDGPGDSRGRRIRPQNQVGHESRVAEAEASPEGSKSAVLLAEALVAAAPPASSRVLRLDEMCEAIFVNLPIRDLLLRLPLVCRAWRGVIESSPKLQQALFLRPLPGKPLHFLQHERNNRWAESKHDPHCYTVHGNPFFHSLYQVRERQLSLIRRAALLRPEASWRKMLVCQPRTIKATDLFETSVYYHDHEAADGVGLRFRDLVRNECAAPWSQSQPLQLSNRSVYGQCHWKDVRNASEVQRIVRPRPKWLLPTSRAQQG